MKRWSWLLLPSLLAIACQVHEGGTASGDASTAGRGNPRTGAGGGGMPASGGAGGGITDGGRGGAGGGIVVIDGGRDGAGGSGGTIADGGHGGTGGIVVVIDAGRGGAGGATAQDAASDVPTDALATCATLLVKYASALTEAKRCSAAANANQCQALAPLTLACPTCMTHVHDTGSLDALTAQWTAAGCGGVICPLAIACPAPGTGTCTPAADGSATGMCVDL